MTESRRRYMPLALIAAGGLVLSVAAAVLVEYFGSAPLSGRSTTDLPGSATGSARSTEAGAAMSLHETSRPLPELRFEDGDGRAVSLADFRGGMVLLNVWATWCGPCRREMPTLDGLQAKLGGPDFGVVALSIDRAGIEVVAEFYAEVGVAHLTRYIDDSGKAARQLNAVGLPTTLLIDREGREIARHVGPAEWDTPEMVRFFRQQLSRKPGVLRPGGASDRTSSRADRRPLAEDGMLSTTNQGSSP